MKTVKQIAAIYCYGAQHNFAGCIKIVVIRLTSLSNENESEELEITAANKLFY